MENKNYLSHVLSKILLLYYRTRQRSFNGRHELQDGCRSNEGKGKRTVKRQALVVDRETTHLLPDELNLEA